MIQPRVPRLLLSPIKLIIWFLAVFRKIEIPSRSAGAGSWTGTSRRKLDWGPESRYRPHHPIV